MRLTGGIAGAGRPRCGSARDDKIVIKRGHNGHYVYFSVRNEGDNGSIIDFAASQESESRLGTQGAARLVRPGRPPPKLPPLEQTGKDRLAVETHYRRMQDAPEHPYLIQKRRLPPELLALDRFGGCVRIDERRNAVFPHFDKGGLCVEEPQLYRLCQGRREESQ